MKHQLLFLPVFIFATQFMAGQKLSRQKYVLDSVFIEGISSKSVFEAYPVKSLPDSVSNTLSLPELLAQNTAIFVREYGKGMLAGISLRGTGAAHTQIVWNGIPVNSILNGQTDLNTFSPGGFDEIFVKKSGSSVSFGSGAIGGVVIFNDKITFSKKFKIANYTKLGSFKTGINRFKIISGNQKIYTKFSLQIQKSKNDYIYPGYNIKNENGKYQGWDFALINGLKFRKHQLYVKSKISKLDRETSRTLYMPQKGKLLTGNTYLLGGWLWQNKYFDSRTELVYLNENYQYYFNKNLPANSQSKAQTLLARNLINIAGKKSYKLMIGNEISRQTGTGDNIGKHIRINYASFLIWSHQLNKLTWQIKLRQDINPDIKIPLTGAIALSFPFHLLHRLRLNASKNFRLPTFNDLYWIPGGNPQLQPETSYGLDAGYDYQRPDFETHLTFFYIDSRNLIKWIPGNNQYWYPENFESVQYSGVELAIFKKFNIDKNWALSNKINLDYNRAINLKTGKFLPYTPQITGLNVFNVTYKRYHFVYRYRYQGKIYTTTSNTKFLPAYPLHNVSLAFDYGKHFEIQFNVNNVLNTYYENVPSRPQPGRYYEIILNFKI